MKKIDFDKVKYQSYPLDKELKQPVEEIIVKQCKGLETVGGSTWKF